MRADKSHARGACFEALDIGRWLCASAGFSLPVRVGAVTLLQVVRALCGVALAFVMRYAVDRAMAGDGRGFAYGAATFAAVLLAQVCVAALARATAERTRVSMENSLRQRLFRRAVCIRRDDGHTSETMTRMTSDVALVGEGAAMLVPSCVASLVQAVAVLAALFVLSPSLAWCLLAVAFVVAGASAAIRPLLKRLHVRVQESEASMRLFLQDGLDAAAVVRVFGVQNNVDDQAKRTMEAHRVARLRSADASIASSAALAVGMRAHMRRASCGAASECLKGRVRTELLSQSFNLWARSKLLSQRWADRFLAMRLCAQASSAFVAIMPKNRWKIRARAERKRIVRMRFH